MTRFYGHPKSSSQLSLIRVLWKNWGLQLPGGNRRRNCRKPYCLLWRYHWWGWNSLWCINAKLQFYHNCVLKKGKVGQRSKDQEGYKGDYDPNILLVLYDVVFDNGDIKQYLANMIVQNIFQQVDQDGYSLLGQAKRCCRSLQEWTNTDKKELFCPY